MLRSRGNRSRLPVACPVCACERIDDQGRGINCVCSSCGEKFPESIGHKAWESLVHYPYMGWPEWVEGLTGAPDELEPGDVVEFMEDPDDRPFWVWDI